MGAWVECELESITVDHYSLEGMGEGKGIWPMKEPVPTVCVPMWVLGAFGKPGLSIPGFSEVLAPRPDSAASFAVWFLLWLGLWH